MINAHCYFSRDCKFKLSLYIAADPKTIFAPTNKAFLALPEQFMADPEALRSLVLDHVSWGTKYFLGLSSGTITSVNGNSVESALSKGMQRVAIYLLHKSISDISFNIPN